MCMESEALKEINELKAQVNAWDEAYSNYVYRDSDDKFLDMFISTPKQCLKQHNIALLQSIADEFINSNQSCELILASRIHSMECEDD